MVPLEVDPEIVVGEEEYAFVIAIQHIVRNRLEIGRYHHVVQHMEHKVVMGLFLANIHPAMISTCCKYP